MSAALGPVPDPNVHVVVGRAADLVSDHYVFDEVAKQISALLLANLAAGRYDACDLETLAALVTDDLQSVNGDRHLRLVHHLDAIGDMADEAEWLARQETQAAETMGGIARIERLPGNIGLLALAPALLSARLAGDAIAAAMRIVADTNGLILDLRDLRGGTPGAVVLLCTYLLDAEPVHLNTLVTRDHRASRQVWTAPWVPGPRYGADKPVWVLTSATTFSAGEAIAFDLQQLGRATVVGETTGGGAHVREGFTLHPNLELTVPVMRPESPIDGGNWEGGGVRPDVEVPAAAALTTAHRLAMDHVVDADASPALRREIAAAAPGS